MFVARDARGELVNVLEDKLEKQAYTCPACGGQIHLRQGQVYGRILPINP